MYKPKITPEEMKALREKTGCGMLEARNILVRERVREDFHSVLYSENPRLDIFEIIGYALFEMKR